MKIFVETERLILRELVPNDALAMFEMDSDIKVHQFLGNKPVKSIEESQNQINFIRNQYIENGIGRWAVVEKKTNNFVGWSGLKLITEKTNNHINYYDIGYRFLKNYWGKGYATESAMATRNYGFDKLGLQKMYGIADINNLGSIKVLEKTGLRKIEIFNYEAKPHYWMKIEKQY